MRPQSIVMFERLFLASLVLSAANFALSYQAAVAEITNNPGAQQLGLGSGFLIGVTGAGFALYLLLWFLIARQASVVAKWILVVCTVLGALFVLPALTGSWNVTLVLSLVVHALELLSVVYLFKPTARAWLGGRQEADAATAD